MKKGKPATEATLLDVLIDGFEKNEILDGHHWRELPVPDVTAARARFDVLRDEARRWKGEPSEVLDEEGRCLARWPDLELRQAGAGIMVRVRSPWFGVWWNDDATWQHEPMDAIWKWLEEESG